ncbi:membrane protein [Alkalihalobacillus alcalophilus ATCC 27647 = CGMCC 1.3604]|uniref:Membrane protein n=1 Tax=Alkalihalobacillus alcalophilus ATCC 27647 = CGMCC 1.3604 TaxID=1218173 RepID=A0A094WFG0_ALKAL|nr:TIGR04086 family membrane protein [Alkalihalobacillus alcalophilus]KGA96509.1 membrane protein [Alkalihalobacillus alcalophilus ATCC 27647 = CGMCC 1.3604]MED1561563.1 TIGR04086 family membrane protein [Alkalihalobacillus alcalophilus]THG90546.1 membrane protein [Alkalihalobacillus alcalophilus ATCC 27647 = CGMCC 1.3604]
MESYRNFFPAVVMGLLTIFSVAVVFSLIAATILSLTNLTEHSLDWLIKIVAFLTILIGGLVAGAKSKSKGLMIGAVTAILFTLITFLVQFLGYDQAFTTEQYMYHGGYLLIGALGGMVGVNLFGGNS